MPLHIDKLTQAQIDRFPEWVERWTNIGLSCDPADFEQAIAGASACYTNAKYKVPLFLRMSSPYGAIMGGVIGTLLLKGANSQVDSQVGSQVHSQVDSQVDSQVYSQVDSQVRSQVYSQVSSQVRSQVHSQVGSQVYSQVDSQVDSQVYSQVDSQVYSQVSSQVRSQVHSQVGSQVDSQVGSQVGSQVDSQVRSQVYSQVRSQVGSTWTQYRGGNLWSGWFAYISFLRDACGWSNSTLAYFAADESVATAAGWWWLGDHVCAISDRPERLSFDEDGRGHCETGPAFSWRDGWSIWLVHGVGVDEQVVMRPGTQTVKQIDRERNEEVKRVRIERFGWERYLGDSNASIADERFNERDQQRERLYVTKEGIKRIVVSDPSTGRRYALGCPRDVGTCEQAQHFLSHGLDRRALHRS